jgi:hypothetical protein
MPLIMYQIVLDFKVIGKILDLMIYETKSGRRNNK